MPRMAGAADDIGQAKIYRAAAAALDDTMARFDQAYGCRYYLLQRDIVNFPPRR